MGGFSKGGVDHTSQQGEETSLNSLTWSRVESRREKSRKAQTTVRWGSAHSPVKAPLRVTLAHLIGASDYLIVHVRDSHHHDDAAPEHPAEDPPNYIKSDVGAERKNITAPFILKATTVIFKRVCSLYPEAAQLCDQGRSRAAAKGKAFPRPSWVRVRKLRRCLNFRTQHEHL